MTATEMIENIASLGPQDLHVLLHYLADRVLVARLANDSRLCHATDFKGWLQELGDVALRRATSRCRLALPPSEQERWRA